MSQIGLHSRCFTICRQITMTIPRVLSWAKSPLSVVPDETSFALQTDHLIGTFSRPIDFPVEAHALLCSRLRQGGCGCNHGFQYTRHHGQGRTEEADREHEVPGVHGTVAPVKEHRGVSASRRQPNRIIVDCCLLLSPAILLFTNFSEGTEKTPKKTLPVFKAHRFQ